jgi:hypothetical protein
MTLDDIKKHINDFKSGNIGLDKIIDLFQEFINSNPEIRNLYYLKSHKEYSSVHYFLIKHRAAVLSKLTFPVITTPANTYSHIKTIEDIQKFIDEHPDITCPRDLRKNYRGVDAIRGRFPANERNKIKWPNYNKLDFSYIKNISDWQNFIDENKIDSPIKLNTISEGLYGKYFRELSREDREKLRWKNKQKPRTLPENRRDWSNINTIEQFQKFIYDNQVVSISDLQKRFRGLVQKFQNRLKEVVFVGPASITTGEAFLIRKLIKYGVNFIYQKTFPDCKNILAYRFDLYLIDLNVLLEYHGAAHFGEGIRYTEDLIKADKAKNEYAKTNNIRLYYFTFEKKLYESNGYFDKVYTDAISLFTDIGIDTTKVNPNYEKEIKDFFAQDIAYFNNFILKNKITSLKELREKYPSVYGRVKRKKLKDYIEYYKS